MAKMRMVKVEFFQDPKVGRLDHEAKLLFISMWQQADDYGNGPANAAVLRGVTFPFNPIITVADVEAWLKSIAAEELIRFYTVRGERYYSVVNFLKHQHVSRPSKFCYPTPVESDENRERERTRKARQRAAKRQTSKETPGDTSATGVGQSSQGTDTTGWPQTTKTVQMGAAVTITTTDAKGAAPENFDSAGTAPKSPEPGRPSGDSQVEEMRQALKECDHQVLPAAQPPSTRQLQDAVAVANRYGWRQFLEAWEAWQENMFRLNNRPLIVGRTQIGGKEVVTYSTWPLREFLKVVDEYIEQPEAQVAADSCGTGVTDGD